MFLNRLATHIRRQDWFLVAIDQAAYTYTPTLRKATFEDLRSTGNMRLIRDRWLLVKPQEANEVRAADAGDREEVMAAVQRLRNRPDAVSWLTRLRGMQMEQLRVHNIRMDMAHETLDALRR